MEHYVTKWGNPHFLNNCFEKLNFIHPSFLCGNRCNKNNYHVGNLHETQRLSLNIYLSKNLSHLLKPFATHKKKKDRNRNFVFIFDPFTCSMHFVPLNDQCLEVRRLKLITCFWCRNDKSFWLLNCTFFFATIIIFVALMSRSWIGQTVF